MVDVAVKLKLGSETLFLAVLYLDRCLARVPVTQQRLQLLGTCCLLVASKVEEIYPPRADEFSLLADGAFAKEDLISAEPDVLSALDFNMTSSTTLRFFTMYSRLVGLSSQAAMTGRYLCELAITKTDCARIRPSLLAAGIVYLLGRLFLAAIEWPDLLAQKTGYQLADVRHAAKPVYMALLAARLPGSCSAVVRKYSSDKYLRVSFLKVDHFG